VVIISLINQRNTIEGYQSIIEPRVKSKRGYIIKPLSFDDAKIILDKEKSNLEKKLKIRIDTKPVDSKKEIEKRLMERNFERSKKDKFKMREINKRIRLESIEHVATDMN
jgi:guanylate kinase